MAVKANVLWSLISYSGFKRAFVLILFFAYPEYGVSEECNFLKCTLNTMSFIASLRRDKSQFDCSKFLDMEGCSDHCMHMYYPKQFSSDFEPHEFSHFCSTKIALTSNVNWSCIARHAFRLLTCLGNVSSLRTNNVHDHAIAKESCRQSLEFPKCASSVLLDDCGENSVELVKDMFQYAVNYFMPSACKAMNTKKIVSMHVYFYIEDRFLEIANCLDSYIREIIPCFRQLLQNDFDLKEFVCGQGEAFISCVAFQARKECKDTDDKSVRKLLLKFFSLGGIRCEQHQYAFPQLTSHDSAHSEEVKSSTMQIDPTEPIDSLANHPSLNDDYHVLPNSDSDFMNLSTVQTVINTDETDSSVSTMFPIHDARNVSSTINEKKIHTSDSFLNNSENPSKIKDSNFLKTSSAVNLICDKTLVTFVSVLISLIL